MNTKRILFWSVFFIIIALIIWGLVVAMKKAPATTGLPSGRPAPVTASDHVLGPENAPVTLIEYSDFQCPACEEYYSLVTKLVSESSTTLRLVYRQFPLSQHPNAMSAALASEAAGAQGKFWGMYDLLFANHADWTELADPKQVFAGYAAKIGLDMNEYAADLSSSTLRDQISASEQEGQDIGISYTPTFFVNGKAIANPQGYEAFKAIIDAAAR